jgi:hypothetical protein
MFTHGAFFMGNQIIMNINDLGMKLLKQFNLPEKTTDIDIHIGAGQKPTIKATFIIDDGEVDELLATLSECKRDN